MGNHIVKIAKTTIYKQMKRKRKRKSVNMKFSLKTKKERLVGLPSSSSSSMTSNSLFENILLSQLSLNNRVGSRYHIYIF